MSYTLEPRRLKKLIDYYSPINNCEQIKFLKVFDGEQGLLRHLQTSPFQGIDSTSIEERIAQFGSNEVSSVKEHRNYCQLFFEQLNYLPTKLCIIFTLVTLMLGIFYTNKHIDYPWVEGVLFLFLFFVTYILKIVPQIQMQRENNAIKQFKEIIGDCTVWRDNEKFVISASKLVVGDIVELEEGSVIGADGILIEGEVLVKEKFGTFERQAIKMTKKQSIELIRSIASKKKFMANFQSQRASPIIIGNSTVIRGAGRMMVLCVGKYSQKGYKQMLIDESCQRKSSKTEQKVKALIFQCSKDMVLGLIILVILYIVKHTIFIIINKSLQTTNWQILIRDLLHCLTLFLSGIPYFMFLGLSMGLLHIKFSIWNKHEIYYKYSTDCDRIGNISTIIYEQNNDRRYYKFKRWWNHEFQNSENLQISNHLFRNIFYSSLQPQDFDPFDIGLDIPSFYIGINEREAFFLNKALDCVKEQNKKQLNSAFISEINIDEESQICEKIVKKYFKGNAETLLKICTHILNKKSGEVESISGGKREEIQKLIWKINLNNGIALMSGYIQVNLDHPRYRDGDSKIVLVSVLDFQIHEDIEEFQAFLRIRRENYNFLLVSNKDQEELLAKGRQMGLIVTGKPSINLKGYDLLNIIGGVLCKSCKKSICICPQHKKKISYILKNQDQFVSIQKHICTLSEANMLEKLTVVVGYKNSQNEGACIFGSKIEDIPSMKASQLSFYIQNSGKDNYAKLACQVILKEGKLSEISHLINWSTFTFLFYKKFVLLFLTPCLTAFISNCVGFLFFDTEAIKLIQFLWTITVICSFLGITFSFSDPQLNRDSKNEEESSDQNIEQNDNKNIQDERKPIKQSQIIDKSNSRHLISQVGFQILIVMFIYLFGHHFIPEQEDEFDKIIGQNIGAKYSNQQKNLVCWGARRNIFKIGQDVYETTFQSYQIYSRHFTIVFNIFVLLQFMNYLLTRVSHKPSLNVFEGMNIKTVIMIILAALSHCLLIQFGGSFMGLYPYGLTLIQWSISLGLSMIACILGILIKQIPMNEQKEGDNKYRIWPNKAYNLAVMAIAPRQDFIDFQIDEDFAFEEKIKQGHNE